MPPSRSPEQPGRMEPTVLIVDDDPAAVEFLKAVIAQSPRAPRYRVVTANWGFGPSRRAGRSSPPSCCST